ncbi:hypothetical protein FACS1894170_09550 [Planctomycetales bacterium]|nr:hypothetical protein FACS1894170_09550 [Planctomycetales bacterium]
MSNYFKSDYFPEPQWNLLGHIAAPMANPIVPSLYPMEWMTKFHQSHHITGLTGRWMDTLPGRIHPGGWYHRIQHGHHLFGDGMTALTHPKLKYGEFLHHLGMDTLTKHGVPNPLLPTGTLFNTLKGLGVSANTANELLTVNLPKLLGGSLSLACAGSDVWACFADTIPHTWTATGWHLGLGVLDLVWGCYPPNPFVLLAGGAEIGVGITTGLKTLIDTFQPATQSVFDSASVFFPVWGEAVALSAIFGACVGYWSGQSLERITKGASITVVSSATGAAISGALTGNFIAPFIGGAAGFLTGLLLRQIFLTNGENELAEKIKKPIVDYFAPPPYFGGSPYFDAPSPYFGGGGAVVPIMQLLAEPIGMLKDDKLIFDEKAIRKRFES